MMSKLEMAMKLCGYNQSVITACLKGQRQYIFCPLDEDAKRDFEDIEYDEINVDGKPYLLAVER